jgi:5-deoxy-D-glucuronate isomerase
MVLVQVDVAAGNKGLINIDEIAAMEGHMRSQATHYEEWTLVTLKGGREVDVHESISALLGRIESALGKPVVNA